MNMITLQNSSQTEVTILSNRFIDTYMPEANVCQIFYPHYPHFPQGFFVDTLRETGYSFLKGVVL